MKTKKTKRGPNRKSLEMSNAMNAFTFAADNLSNYLGLLQQKSILEISALERAMKQMDQTDKVLANIAMQAEPKADKRVSDVFGNG